MEQSIHYPNIGEVTFVSSATAKNLRISLKPFCGIRVTIPRRTSLKRAMAFVEEKTAWILKAKSRMEQHERTFSIFMPDTDFSTHSHQLRLIPWKSERFRARVTKEQLQVFYPQDVDLTSDNAQKTIRHYVIETIRKEAKAYLPLRTEQLATEHGFCYQGVTVKNLSSRWGSCSAGNHINLNIHLMRLPSYLIDYVILHELAHTIHKNHGPDFWRCLDEHVNGQAKQLAAEMKKCQTGWF